MAPSSSRLSASVMPCFPQYASSTFAIKASCFSVAMPRGIFRTPLLPHAGDLSTRRALFYVSNGPPGTFSLKTEFQPSRINKSNRMARNYQGFGLLIANGERLGHVLSDLDHIGTT